MVQTSPRRGSWAVDWVMTQSLNEIMALEGLDRGKKKLELVESVIQTEKLSNCENRQELD